MYPDQTLAIFVKPPSLNELEDRLRKRGTDSEEKIKDLYHVRAMYGISAQAPAEM